MEGFVMNRRVVWIALLGAICSGFSLRAEEAPESPPSKTHLVEAGLFEATVMLDGFVQSTGSHEIQVKPEEWTSFVVERAIESGSSVKAGDELVKFESKAFQRELENLMLEQNSGQTALLLAQIELKLIEKTNPLDLEAAERTATVALDEWNEYVKQGEALEKQTAGENLKMAQDTLDGSQEELNQLQKMYKADDLTEETEEIILKRARREVERSQFMFKTAQILHDRRLEQEIPREKRLKEVAKDREALNLQKTRENLPVTLTQKKLEVEKLKYTQDHLLLKMQQMKQDEQLLTLNAPIDGVVVYGQAEYGKWTTTEAMRSSLRPGGTITPHQVIMTIIPDQAASLWVEIPEQSIGHCQAGQTGEFFPTAYTGTSIPCHLNGFSRVFAKEGVFGGQITIDAPQDAPRPRSLMTGMTGKVRLVQFTAKDALAVPSVAVFTDEENPNQRYVYVSQEDQDPRKQIVEVGLSSATRTHIKSGLQAGDKILLTKPEDN